MSALSRRLRLDRVLLSGPAALVLALVVIVVLTGLEFLRDRQTLNGPLAVVRLARLADVPATTAFVGLQASPRAEELWGLSPAGGDALIAREWILDGSGRGPIAPRASVRLAARLGPAALLQTASSPDPRLLLAHDAGSRTELQEYALGPRPRLLRAAFTSIPAAGAGTVRQIAAQTEPGHPALVVVDTRADGATTVTSYAGALGTGPRLLAERTRYQFPVADWRLAISAGQGPLALEFLTRNRSPSHRAELHVLPASRRFAAFGQQQPTPVPEDEPRVAYTVVSAIGEEPLLVAVDSRPALVGAFSLGTAGAP